MLADKIRELCKAKGTTVYAAEKACGLAVNTICKWNESSPRAKNLKAVADYLNVTVDELLKEAAE